MRSVICAEPRRNHAGSGWQPHHHANDRSHSSTSGIAMIESTLLQHFAGYIDGKWAESSSGATLAVRNPATGDHLADLPDMGSAQTNTAIEATDRALRVDISP